MQQRPPNEREGYPEPPEYEPPTIEDVHRDPAETAADATDLPFTPPDDEPPSGPEWRP
jgi:hypothetical protein